MKITLKELRQIIKEEVSNTDCRSEVGITVGLIDGIIATCRVLKDRNKDNDDVIEVLKDLGDDEDFKQLLDDIESVKNED